MPIYVLANEQEVVKYPYNAGLLIRDNPNTSFPKTIPKNTLNSFGMYEVAEVKPDFDSTTQRLQKPDIPVYQDGQWQLVYQVVDKTQAEIDAALDVLKSKCHQELDKKLEEKWLVIKNGYTTYEADTFAFQVEEAKAYQADNNADTPFIDAAMGATSKADYCALVISNNVPYRQAGGAVVNLRRTLEAMIESASTESDYMTAMEAIKNA